MTGTASKERSAPRPVNEGYRPSGQKGYQPQTAQRLDPMKLPPPKGGSAVQPPPNGNGAKKDAL